MNTNAKKILIVLALVLIMLCIGFFSLADDKTVKDTYYQIGDVLGKNADWVTMHKNNFVKYGHISAYFLITLLFMGGGYFKTSISVFMAICVGGVVELMQMLTPARQPLFIDFVYNSSGVIAAAAVYVFGSIFEKER